MKSDLQIGKQGITEKFIENIKKMFANKRTIRISVLKSARSEGNEGKNEVKKYCNLLLNKLGKNYNSTIIGFTIVIKKWRREVRN